MAVEREEGVNGWRNGSGPQSIVDQVTESLLTMVIEGVLAPGTDVAIQDLSNRIGVSHVPVREALRRLESRGLIIFRRGHRPQVAAISIEDFDDIFRIRRVVEADAAQRSARLFSGGRVKALHSVAAGFRDALKREGAPILVPSLHVSLHFALLPGASPWDRQILEQLWDASERYIQLFVKRSSLTRPGIQKIITDHDRLIDAAGTTNPSRYREVVVDHIDGSIESIRPMLIEMTAER